MRARRGEQRARTRARRREAIGDRQKLATKASMRRRAGPVFHGPRGRPAGAGMVHGARRTDWDANVRHSKTADVLLGMHMPSAC